MLTIAIPDSMLAMTPHDPWAHGGPPPAGPRERPDTELASDLIPNDNPSAATRGQAERDRRASVVSASPRPRPRR